MFLSKTLDLTDLFTWLTPATDTGHSVLRLVACRVFRACWHHWRPRRWCWNMLLMMMLGRNVKVAWIMTKKKGVIFFWFWWLISSPVLNSEWVIPGWSPALQPWSEKLVLITPAIFIRHHCLVSHLPDADQHHVLELLRKHHGRRSMRECKPSLIICVLLHLVLLIVEEKNKCHNPEFQLHMVDNKYHSGPST